MNEYEWPHQQSSHVAELHWSVESIRLTDEKESCPLEFYLKPRQSLDQDRLHFPALCSNGLSNFIFIFFQFIGCMQNIGLARK